MRNAAVEVGDGGAGLPAHAPYDAIVTTAVAPTGRPLRVTQLADGGRLGRSAAAGHEEVRLFSKQGGALVAIRGLVSARFIALLGRFGVQ